MNNGGLLAVEIHEANGNEIKKLFTMHGLKNVEVVRDIFGKDRIVKGIVSSCLY
jgi:methylase of polypeptide subunit release factors